MLVLASASIYEHSSQDITTLDECLVPPAVYVCPFRYKMPNGTTWDCCLAAEYIIKQCSMLCVFLTAEDNSEQSQEILHSLSCLFGDHMQNLLVNVEYRVQYLIYHMIQRRTLQSPCIPYLSRFVFYVWSNC